MSKNETTWQGILRVLSDGNRHTYAEIGDTIGRMHNTVERYVHDLRAGDLPCGPVKIESERMPGKNYSWCWLVGAAQGGEKKKEPIAQSKPKSCVCGVSMFFSTRHGNGSWRCSECGRYWK